MEIGNSKLENRQLKLEDGNWKTVQRIENCESQVTDSHLLVSIFQFRFSNFEFRISSF